MKRIVYGLLSILLIYIIGCAGIQYTDNVKTINLAQRDKQQTTTKVWAAAQEWRNSGVTVEKGKRYEIRAKGRWSPGAACGWAGPDGIGATNLACIDIGLQTVKEWGVAALIGKIGIKGTPFGVGNELELEPEEEGILFFKMNFPGLLGDSSGSVDVTIALKDTDKKVAARPSSITVIEDNQKNLPIIA